MLSSLLPAAFRGAYVMLSSFLPAAFRGAYVMLSSVLPAAFRGAYVMLLRKHLDGNTQLPAEILLLPTICIPIASGLEYTIASRDSIALYDMYSDIFSLFSLRYNANIRTDTYSDICRRPSAGLIIILTGFICHLRRLYSLEMWKWALYRGHLLEDVLTDVRISWEMSKGVLHQSSRMRVGIHNCKQRFYCSLRYVFPIWYQN
jgi:hypothetical protein